MKVAIIHGGSGAEYDKRLVTSTQFARCLDDMGFDFAVVDAHEVHPERWDEINWESTTALMLDPFFTSGIDRVDLRDFFQSRSIPYTGPRKAATRITHNKIECKRVLSSDEVQNIPHRICKTVASCVNYITQSNQAKHIVKPICGGGGADVHLVDHDSLDQALLRSLMRRHGAVMVEPHIAGKEVALSLLANRGAIRPLQPVEIKVEADQVFSLNTKNGEAADLLSIPADVSSEASALMAQFGAAACKTLRFTGVLRVDFISTDSTVYFLEANAYPYLSSDRLTIPAARASKLSQNDIVKFILKTARTDLPDSIRLPA